MKRTRVLIDGFFLDKPYGFGRFIYELCRSLSMEPGEIEFIVATPERCFRADFTKFARLNWVSLPNVNFAFWEQVIIPRTALRLSCDLIHFPYNTKAVFTFGIPTVTTVHDLIFLDEKLSLRNKKAYLASLYSKFCFKYITKRSSKVVSVSNTTAKLLSSRGIDSTTVYNTVDGFIERATKGSVNLNQKPYLLHRGGYLEHRNTARVIGAFLEAKSSIGNVELKILGVPDGQNYFGLSSSEPIVFLDRISDGELAVLYSNCIGILATTLREGFGLPIIEGFGFGSPVITSNINPMLEVAGGAALIVDPYSTEDISMAICDIVNNGELSRELVSKGTARMKDFSSEKVKDQMIEIYRSCVLGAVL